MKNVFLPDFKAHEIKKPEHVKCSDKKFLLAYFIKLTKYSFK